MISKWKAEFLENMASVFDKGNSASIEEDNSQALYAEIGKLKVENEFLKKSCKKLGI